MYFFPLQPRIREMTCLLELPFISGRWNINVYKSRTKAPGIAKYFSCYDLYLACLLHPQTHKQSGLPCRLLKKGNVYPTPAMGGGLEEGMHGVHHPVVNSPSPHPNKAAPTFINSETCLSIFLERLHPLKIDPFWYERTANKQWRKAFFGLSSR